MKNLSALQKCILLLGTKKRLVTPADVKAAYYNFPRRYPSIRPGGLVFSVKEIGLNRYRCASVSISRSFANLTLKEVVIRSYYGVSLSEKGMEVAQNHQEKMLIS
jgi:hypothetical protein